MKKFNLLLFIILLSFNVFSQIKTCTYEKYGLMSESTHNYAIPIDNKLIINRDKNNLFTIKIHDSDLTKAPIFTLSKIHLNSYDEFRERYIYIGDANREGAANGKCMIISVYKLDSYLGDKGKEDDNYLSWDKRLSFTIYLKNLRFRNKMYDEEFENYEEYLKDISMTIFPLKNKIINKPNPNFNIKNISDKEKRELLKPIKLYESNTQSKEENKEEKIEIEKIEKILSEVNIEEKISQIKTEIENHYKSMIKDKIVKDYGYNYNTNASIRGKFILHINRDKKIEIIRKDIDAILEGYIVVSDDKDKIFNREILQQKERYADEYEIGGYTYYKLNNNIFTDDCIIDKEFTIGTGSVKVKFKNNKFKYFSVIPKIVENWCAQNITTNGLYSIKYINIDGELICIDDRDEKISKKILEYQSFLLSNPRIESKPLKLEIK